MDRHGWDERYAAREQTFPLDPNRLVAAEVDGLPPGRALDLATGEGRHAVWLASLGWQVVAVDFSLVGVARAQRRARAEGLDGIAFAAADVCSLHLPESRFDLVLAAFFHPRPPARDHLYQSVARTLRPGGGSFVQVSYDRANGEEGCGGPKDPEILVDPSAVRARLEGLGLRVERADSVRLRVPTPEGGEVDVVDAIIRAVRK